MTSFALRTVFLLLNQGSQARDPGGLNIQAERVFVRISEKQLMSAWSKSQKLEEYTCDSCGEDVEVIDGEYPERCPGCLRIITW